MRSDNCKLAIDSHVGKENKMPVKFKVNGRTVSSPWDFADAIVREMKANYEKVIRRAAATTGAAIRKSGDNFNIEGTPEQIERFTKRLGS